jgi:NADH dehydrogenase
MPYSFPLQDAKRAVEERLRNAGLAYTILQPTFFMEGWIGPMVGFDYSNFKAQIPGTGENRISWISYLDVACFAAAALDNPAARNATLELGGPEAISPLQVVKIFEQAGGKPFEVTHVPVEALQGQLAAAEDPLQKSFAGLMLSYTVDQPIDMSQTVKTFPLRLRTVEEYARRVMGAA